MPLSQNPSISLGMQTQVSKVHSKPPAGFQSSPPATDSQAAIPFSVSFQPRIGVVKKDSRDNGVGENSEQGDASISQN